MFLEISQNSQKNTYARVSTFATLLKKETLAQVFLYEFWKISKILKILHNTSERLLLYCDKCGLILSYIRNTISEPGLKWIWGIILEYGYNNFHIMINLRDSFLSLFRDCNCCCVYSNFMHYVERSVEFILHLDDFLRHFGHNWCTYIVRMGTEHLWISSFLRGSWLVSRLHTSLQCGISDIADQR